MGYAFIKYMLLEHYPMQSDTGVIHCTCNWVDLDVDGDGDARWAEHVEQIYNAGPLSPVIPGMGAST